MNLNLRFSRRWRVSCTDSLISLIDRPGLDSLDLNESGRLLDRKLWPNFWNKNFENSRRLRIWKFEKEWRNWGTQKLSNSKNRRTSPADSIELIALKIFHWRGLQGNNLSSASHPSTKFLLIDNLRHFVLESYGDPFRLLLIHLMEVLESFCYQACWTVWTRSSERLKLL